MSNLAPACSECGDTGKSHRVELESGWICIPCIQKMETRANRLEEMVDRLEDWKDSALEVEREWDVQAIAKMLGGELGDSCRRVIAEKVPLLLADNVRLTETIAVLKAEVKSRTTVMTSMEEHGKHLESRVKELEEEANIIGKKFYVAVKKLLSHEKGILATCPPFLKDYDKCPNFYHNCMECWHDNALRDSGDKP